MLLNLLLGGDIESFLISLALSLPIVLFSLSLHETAHGFVAYKLGDPTAHNLGRLTLNPFRHLDPIGFGCMLLFGYGWAKPVPINTRYFKKPKRDIALTGAAGPASNLLLALAFSVLLRLSYGLLWERVYTSATLAILAEFLCLFLFYGIRINAVLAVFNLIPIPPFDGSRILFAFLPYQWSAKLMRYEQFLYIAVILLMAFTSVFDVAFSAVIRLFLQLVGLGGSFFWYLT